MATLNTIPNASTLDELLSADGGVARLNVDVHWQTYGALKEYAKARKKTLSQVVRAMIALHLNSSQTASAPR